MISICGLDPLYQNLLYSAAAAPPEVNGTSERSTCTLFPSPDSAPDPQGHPPPLFNRLEDLTSVAEFQDVFRDIFQGHWAYVSNGGKLTCPTLSPLWIASRRENGKARGCIIDLDLPSPGEALKTTGKICRLKWGHEFGRLSHVDALEFRPVKGPQNLADDRETCLYRFEAESLVYTLGWFVNCSANRFDRQAAPNEAKVKRYLDLNPTTKSPKDQARDVLSNKIQGCHSMMYSWQFAPVIDGWLFPLWRLIHEGYFLAQRYPTESLEYQTLCGCLTFARIMDILADKEERALERALALPLPPDDGDDFPESRRPVIQRLLYTASLEEFKEAFVGIVEAHHEFCARFCTCFGPFTPNRLASRESQTSPGGLDGVFIDLDDMRPPTPSQFVTRRTDPLVFPFIAWDLIKLPLDCGKPYYYRHDLESFMYTLYWYAVRGRFAGKNIRMSFKYVSEAQWSSPSWNFTDKDAKYGRFQGLIDDRLEFMLSLDSYHSDVAYHFQELKWLISLWRLVSAAHLLSGLDPGVAEPRTLNGRLTYESFINILQPVEPAQPTPDAST
ncbi:hypothetical protein BD779DRAFT_861642 [Infundibulicybe gibba]|nr:hypothetical protein BD779DRAFT_861642 [Infundibulicybe gibba]